MYLPITCSAVQITRKLPITKKSFIFWGQEVDVEELAGTAMRFNGKTLTDEDKKAIQNIIEIYLRKE